MMDNRSRLSFYGVCGCYLLYMAYQMIKTVMEYGVQESVTSLIFAILFGVAGIAILITTFMLARKMKKEEEAEKAAEEAGQVESTEQTEEAGQVESAELTEESKQVEPTEQTEESKQIESTK